MSSGTVKLIGFADGSKSWLRSARRFRKQARKSGYFDEIKVYDLHTLQLLDESFFNRHREFIENSPKGFGYWIWKPKIVLEELLNLKSEADILVYLDVGCTFNSDDQSARDRFADYIKIASDTGGLGFELNGLSVNAWTKRLTYKRIMKSDDSLLQTNQVLATAFFLRRTPKSLALVKSWLDYCELENYSLLDDSSSEYIESEDFVAHRHDQAIWSLLVRQNEISILPDETYFAPEWKRNGRNFPIWATRNATNLRWVSESLTAKLLRKILKSL